METIVWALALAALVLFFLIGRRLARWDLARRERRRVARERERERATVASYRAHTTPGRRSDSPVESNVSTPSSWDIPAMSTIHASPEPTGIEPTIIGGGGSFGGSGSSGGWESSSCGSSDYSGSSDSSSSCSSSSSSD